MSQNYYKRTYHDAIELITPEFYLEKDLEISGLQDSVVASVVNSHLVYASNSTSLLNPSATDNYLDIGDISGIGSFFIKQNDRTKLTPKQFELDIMSPLGSSLGDFTSSGDLHDFLSGVLLPKLELNSSALTPNTASAFTSDADSSGTHEYLMGTLGWAYMLNTSGENWSPSSYVASALASKFFKGEAFETVDGVKGLTNYIWRNWSDVSTINTGLLPENFYSGTGKWASGTQNLKRLETLVDVIYSPGAHDEEDVYVRDAFQTYAVDGTFLSEQEAKGPFHRLLQGMSYAFFDTNEDVWGLEDLYNISRCPVAYLPYLADLIGWKLYGSNEESWRRQLQDAVSLYKKKGTKQGLVDALGVVLPTTTVTDSSISEFYESYIPNLIYYLLKTDSDLFTSLDKWTQDRANAFTDGEYDPTDIDTNVRYVIDHLLLRCVEQYPELFYVKNFQFDLDNPEFRFYYRGRSFCLPPWEEEKFYKDCDITEGLVNYLKNQLICLGVSTDNAIAFTNYVLNNTVNGSIDGRFYNNGMFFLTSSLNLAPNKDTILENRDYTKYTYLPLWNGKSSHFDIDVSSGSFTDEFFSTGAFTKTDFFRSLEIIDNFSPAKSIPRARVTLDQTEDLSSLDFLCPSVRYAIVDLAPSTVLGGYQSSGVNMRDIEGFVPTSAPTNSSRASNDHVGLGLPTFKREQVDDSYDFVNLTGSSVSSGPEILVVSDADRTSLRRRNYETNLKPEGLFTRTGFNQPSFYNVSSVGEDFEYWPLGYLPTELRYHPVVSALDLNAVSANPFDLDVWNNCWGVDSDKDISGLFASSFLELHGSSVLASSTCNPYVRREQTPEFFYLLWSVVDKKYQREAEYIVDSNKFLFNQTPYKDAVASVKSWLWNEADVSMTDLLSTTLGKREFGIDSPDGIHKMFKDYIAYFSTNGVGNNNLTTRKDGGTNILSHAYGPLLYNGMFTVEGAGLDADVSSQLLAKSLDGEAEFDLVTLYLDGGVSVELANKEQNTVAYDAENARELRCANLLSGVELVDSLFATGFPAVSSDGKFSLFNFDTSTAVVGRDNYLVGNTICVIKPKIGFARLRFDLQAYDDENNLFVPERDFELTLKSLIGTENSNILGGGSFGVWVHTDIEEDQFGNKYIWTYMPNGKWEKTSFDRLTEGLDSIQYVKQELSHYLDFPESYQTELGKSCLAADSTKEVLLSVQESDFQEGKLKFNTRNQPIAVGLPYYQFKQQVHRADQNYIVEVFPLSNQDDKFFVIDHVSIVDLRQASRTFFKHSFDFADYNKALETTLEDCVFYDPSGNELALGAQMKISSDGDITDANGDKITLAKSQGSVNILAKTTLYSQANATIPQRWVYDTSTLNQVDRSERPYDGIFTYDGSGNFTPSTLVMTGKTKGSHITVSIKDNQIQYSPEETLIILREFNRLQKGLGAREASISINDYGVSGGSRLNYRYAPMWGQTGNYDQFVTNGNRYTDIRIDN